LFYCKKSSVLFKKNIISSFVSIKLRNANGYGPYSEPVDLFIYNEPEPTQDETTVASIDPSLLPTKPRILVTAFDAQRKEFYLKWLLDNNGGSSLTEVNVTFLEYSTSGLIRTFWKSLVHFFLTFF
jgi:hypothetical protein